MLSTDTESKDESNNAPVRDYVHRVRIYDLPHFTMNLQKVTISTVHGAKGLEWPVVFLPCCKRSRSDRCFLQADTATCHVVEDGTYPFYRSTEEDEIREERSVSLREHVMLIPAERWRLSRQTIAIRCNDSSTSCSCESLLAARF